MKKEINVKTNIRKNDKVVVATGKEKGKTGKVVRVSRGNGRVLIGGLNLLKRHVRPTRDMPQGGIVERESSINLSNVMLFCSKCNRGVRTGVKRYPDGTSMRYCKRCELQI